MTIIRTLLPAAGSILVGAILLGIIGGVSAVRTFHSEGALRAASVAAGTSQDTDRASATVARLAPPRY